MSGRAGRRGLDDKGIVILMVDEKMAPSVGRNLVKGLPDRIDSAFHLTYNMVLNLLRVEEINPEYMMERSFHQFQNYSNIPVLFKSELIRCLIWFLIPSLIALLPPQPTEMRDLEKRVSETSMENEEEVSSYHRLREQLVDLGKQFQTWLVKPQFAIPFIQPGRLVSVKHGEKDFGFGAVVNFKKINPKVSFLLLNTF
jgi:ATP-dependent RNA helicase DOB1